jgi:acyl-[acyl-carrier-protein]-phospholipid O-acyltransferase/long-chain-fatty-acid--[acyl-carrier-protein] ligase
VVSILRKLLRGALRAAAIRALRAAYRIRTTGVENLPEGGALLVANHLTHVDALLLGTALAHREVAFLMHRSFFSVPIVGGFSRLMGAMPVASEDSPGEKAASLARAAAAARDGRLVCIFAEGGISRSGALLPFARGLETIAREARVPIVPVALDRLWGSLFSFSGGRFFWKWPRRIPYPVEVSIGAPMAHDSERSRVRSAVAELVARLREARAPRMRSLAYRFLRSARRHNRRTALVDDAGRRLTYRQLLAEALVLRAVLHREIRPLARIGIRLPPGVDAAVAHVAVALAGAVAVPLDGSGAGETHVDMEIQDLASVRSRASWRDRLLTQLAFLCPGRMLARLLDPVRNGLDPAAVHASPQGATPSRLVLHAHSGLASNAQALAQMFRFGPGRSVLGVLPFSSVLGSVSTLWVPMLSGGCSILATRPNDARAIEALGLQERPDVVVATPAMYRAALRAIDPKCFGSVELFFCGGGVLDDDLRSAWESSFEAQLCEGYGCTELAGVVSVNLPGIESRDARQHASKRGTVGRVIPGVAIRIVCPGTGAELPPEVAGRLHVRGPGRMLGYLGEGGEITGGFPGGWFDTGDEAMIDREAFLTITGPRRP